MPYHSQVGQDKFIHDLMGKISPTGNGTFLDIGAYDGVTFSNSLFFEEELGWRGVCVEPNPIAFKDLVRNRPLARNFDVCIVPGDFVGPRAVAYTHVPASPMLSGVTDKYDLRHKDRIKLESKGQEVKQMNIWAFSIGELCSFMGHSLDFLSLDIEGGELDILRSIDWGRHSIRYIAVENNYNDPEFERFMSCHGYVLEGLLSSDMIFARV